MRKKHVLGQTCHGLNNKSGQKDTEASILVLWRNTMSTCTFEGYDEYHGTYSLFSICTDILERAHPYTHQERIFKKIKSQV